MNHSVVDLPDPLDQTASASMSTAMPIGVDDLLAQMAGDEVDRLLAEAEIPRELLTDTIDIEINSATAILKPAALAQVLIQEDVEAATITAERSALKIPVELSANEAPAFDEDENEPSDECVVSMPWYLKPLEWINAPIRFIPREIREAAGKIALLTLFNALAVLIYVCLTRRHR